MLWLLSALQIKGIFVNVEYTEHELFALTLPYAFNLQMPCRERE